jgi:phage-related protein
MPKTEVVFYQEADGACPVLKWLREIPPKAQVKCRIRMERLAEMGHELRRPGADLLRNRVHELRATLNGVHYRLLYFFHGNTAAVLTSGIVKEDRVPPVEIERAIARMKSFEANPAKHTYAREQI